MALIELDKFVASFITEMKECSQMRTFSIPRCIKKAFDDQGLEYKDGEIVKSQRRVSAEAKENVYSEDERIRKRLMAMCQHYIECYAFDQYNLVGYKEAFAWLEKQGQRSQSHWNPSDEQIHAFEQVYDWYNNNFAPSETLTSLYNDLKKLNQQSK